MKKCSFENEGNTWARVTKKQDRALYCILCKDLSRRNISVH